MDLNALTKQYAPSMRIIDQLRKRYGGEWSYDRDMYEWRRSDGLRVYARAHISISEGGCESYHTRWYQDKDGVMEEIWGIHHPRKRSK